MFDKPLAIVDVETTGMAGWHSRIIEIGVLRIENNRIVDSINSLVNPGTYVSPFIQDFTGIKKDELEHAPFFTDISERIHKLLDGAVFVAHNARFDYSFVKNEFKRLDYAFSSKTLCTVQLSRRLFPQEKSHSLSSIIERFDLSFEKRHRAYDDAFAVWQFLQYVQNTLPQETFQQAVKHLLKSSYAGNEMIREQVERLPETSGIYLFYDKEGTPLYVGKSKNIKERVITHYMSDYQTQHHLSMMRKVYAIDAIKTAGELGALLLESRKIKELMPIYNRLLREKHAFIVCRKTINDKGYWTLGLETLDRLTNEGFEHVLGVFKSKKSAKETIGHIVRKHGLCGALCGVEAGKGACFEYKLGRCHGACMNKESAKRYNARFIIAFLESRQFRPWPFAGAIEIVEKNNEEELFDTFTIDKWCLLHKEFDLDTYKILSRFIRYKSPAYRVLNNS